MAKFKKGVSGNPAGRPKGRTNPVLTAVRKEFNTEPEFWEHVAGRAREGDHHCLNILVNRIRAPLRAASAPIWLDIPEGTKTADIVPIVVKAIALGDIPVDDGASLLNALLAGSKLEKLDELERKVDELLGVKNGNL